MPPSPASPANKTQFIADSIVADIAAGRLKSGDGVPSERALAQQFGVSVGTVQRAMNLLENRGLVQREHGRGSYVKGFGASVDTRYLRLRDLQGRELPVYWSLLGWQNVAADPALEKFFGGRQLVAIERRVDVDGRFTLWSRFFLRRKDFRALFKADSPRDDSNLRELISERLAMPTVRVEQSMQHEPIGPEAAQALGMPATDLGVKLEVRGFTVGDRPAYLQRIVGGLFRDCALVVDARVS